MKKRCQIWILACLLSNGLIAQNAPVTTAGTASTASPSVTISITAADFTNISSSNLELHYDSAIANATSVATGPLLGGNLNYNLSVPGKIILGWYVFPAVTLPGNSVLFTITFARVDTGTTAITWNDNGYSCVWYNADFLPLNDLPTQAYYIDGSLTFLPFLAPIVTISTLSGCTGENIDVPVSVSGFKNIGRFTLTMHYDASAVTYQSFTGGGFPGLTVDGSAPGTIVASGNVHGGSSGITLPDSAILFTLQFNFSGGSTALNWSDNGPSCEFNGPPPAYFALEDVPQNVHYHNGSLTQFPLPAGAGFITGPAGGYVYRGQTGVDFHIAPIPGATGYAWSLPPGLTMTGGENTNDIIVSVGTTFKNGNVTVTGVNMCGNGAGSSPFLVTDTTSLGIDIPGEGTTGKGDETRLTLRSFPNPFSETLTFNYFLPVKGNILLEIINTHGAKVATIIDEVEQGGSHTLPVSSLCLPPGIYSARIVLKANNKWMFSITKIVCIE